MAYESRLAKLEAELTPPEPLAPPLIIMSPEEDADAMLAAYVAKHGRKPELVLYITSPEWPKKESSAPTFSDTSADPAVMLPHNGRDPLRE
jgi:hypothetical protein